MEKAISNTDKRDRLSNYDALRIVSAVAVIFIHVNWHFFSSRSKLPSLELNYLVESIINIITRFSVPAFVMISGAFNLRNEKNGNGLSFFKKSLWKIFIPTAMAILLFFLCDILKAVFFGWNLFSSVRRILSGGYYNLWFVYMLAGLYLLTPLTVKLKSVMDRTTYILSSVFLLAWAVVSQAVSNQRVPYAIGVVFAFLGYYLIGDVILNYAQLRHRPPFYFFIAGIMFVLTFIARFYGITYYLSAAYLNFFSPTVTIASVCIFAGVKGISLNSDLSWLSGKAFYLYVFHSIVYETILRIFAKTGIVGHELLQIVSVVTLTFLVSLFIATVYDKFWKSRVSWKQKYDSMKIWEEQEWHSSKVSK